MLKHENLPSTNSTESGVHYNFAKNQENKHTLGNPIFRCGNIDCVDFFALNYLDI